MPSVEAEPYQIVHIPYGTKCRNENVMAISLSTCVSLASRSSRSTASCRHPGSCCLPCSSIFACWAWSAASRPGAAPGATASAAPLVERHLTCAARRRPTNAKSVVGVTLPVDLHSDSSASTFATTRHAPRGVGLASRAPKPRSTCPLPRGGNDTREHTAALPWSSGSTPGRGVCS